MVGANPEDGKAMREVARKFRKEFCPELQVKKPKKQEQKANEQPQPDFLPIL